jgi:hypothetical protein
VLIEYISSLSLLKGFSCVINDFWLVLIFSCPGNITSEAVQCKRSNEEVTEEDKNAKQPFINLVKNALCKTTTTTEGHMDRDPGSITTTTTEDGRPRGREKRCVLENRNAKLCLP